MHAGDAGLLLVARDFPSDISVNYISPWAGAYHRPVLDSSLQALKEINQVQRTYGFFKRVAANESAVGILIKGEEHFESPSQEYLDYQSVRTNI